MSNFIITNIKITKKNFAMWKAILALENRNIGEELGSFIEKDIQDHQYLLRGKNK